MSKKSFIVDAEKCSGCGLCVAYCPAKDKKNPNIEYASLVSALKARGVRFEICEITLKNRNLKKEQFIQEANFTPSGVVRIAKLQLAGQAYIKP